MKKESLIVVFYVLYFFWLLSVTFLNAEAKLLNYFTGGVSVFYFLFLKEKGDYLWFIASGLIPIVLSIVSYSEWQLNFNFEDFKLIPIWLPFAWGTTIVALRRLFYIVRG